MELEQENECKEAGEEGQKKKLSKYRKATMNKWKNWKEPTKERKNERKNENKRRRGKWRR